MSCDKGSCSSPHSNSSCHCDCHKGCGCSCHNKSQGAEGECCVSDPLIQLADQAWGEGLGTARQLWQQLRHLAC